jgi:hypothetical protein
MSVRTLIIRSWGKTPGHFNLKMLSFDQNNTLKNSLYEQKNPKPAIGNNSHDGLGL